MRHQHSPGFRDALNISQSQSRDLPPSTISQMRKAPAKRKRRRYNNKMSSSSMGKRSRKSQSPYPGESAMTSKADILRERSQGLSQQKLGRYTEHLASGTERDHVMKDHLN